MSIRHLIQVRRFSSSRSLKQSFLSANYKSKDLWNERFKCDLLSKDKEVINAINYKIITKNNLSNLELDIFVNISSPRLDDVAQLKESVRILSNFRKSLSSHSILPSTHHAVCRLFMDSKRMGALLNILENRIVYGVFPDFFSLNLLMNEAIEEGQYAFASRLAAMVMLQEEFGLNRITDKLSILSVARYIESKTNFIDWRTKIPSDEAIFIEDSDLKAQINKSTEEVKDVIEENEEDYEDEDDAEYVRVPFLRNPYSDNHFDLDNPRVICGKTLKMLGSVLVKHNHGLSVKSILMGTILEGKWTETIKYLDSFREAHFSMGSLKELATFYIENLHGVDSPSEDCKKSLLSKIQVFSNEGCCLSEIAETECKNLVDLEIQDINWLKTNLTEWSNIRSQVKKANEERESREKLIAEIRAKKEELRLREQYLYFYDNLKKSNLTRIYYN